MLEKIDVIQLTKQAENEGSGWVWGRCGWRGRKKCGFWGGWRSLGFMLGAFCGIGGENYLMDAAAVSVRWRKYRETAYGKQQ